MKTILRFSIVGVWIWAALVCAQAQSPKIDSDKDFAKWVERCLNDFESIKVGTTREEIERKWTMDGGIQVLSQNRYVHRVCGCFKIDVEFDVKGNAADKRPMWEIWSKKDKVIKVSKPYLERPVSD